MTTTSAPTRLRIIVLCIVAFSGAVTMNRAATADERLTRTTAPGRAVLVRGFAAFDADCKVRDLQAVTVVEAPANGRIEQRPGVVAVEESREPRCAGTSLDGVQVYYVPNEGFTGKDHFAIAVETASRRVVHAKVDIDVGKSGDAKDL